LQCIGRRLWNHQGGAAAWAFRPFAGVLGINAKRLAARAGQPDRRGEPDIIHEMLPVTAGFKSSVVWRLIHARHRRWLGLNEAD
jgi:hypothetical protein